MKSDPPRHGGFLVRDLAKYLKVSEKRCLQMMDVAGVGRRIHHWDGATVTYGPLSPDEALKVIHRFRLRKGMRLDL
jgi:hypothetical protein